MNRGLSDGLRVWILGSAATGLLLPSNVVLGQTSNAVPASNKKPAVAQVGEPPRLLSVPNNAGPANPIRPVAGAEKTDVQRELEALYEQDGREMPQLILQPLTPIPGAQNQQSDTTRPQTSPRPNQTNAVNQANQPKPPAASKPVTQTRPSNQRPPSSGTMPWNVQNQIQYTTEIQNQKSNQNTVGAYPNQTPAQAMTQPPMQQPGQQQTAPQPQTQRYPNLFTEDQISAQQQKVQNPKPGFFKRITNAALGTTPQTAPVPPDYRNGPPAPLNPNVPVTQPPTMANVPAIPPAIGNTPQGMQATKYYSPPNLPVVTGNQRPNTPVGNQAPNQLPAANSPTLVKATPGPDLPRPWVPLPALYDQPLPLVIASTQPPVLPGPPAPPQTTISQAPTVKTQAPMVNVQTVTSNGQTPPISLGTVRKSTPPVTMNKVSLKSDKVTTGSPESVGDFPNPFPEFSEADADNRGSKLLKRREIPSNAYIDDPNSKSVVAKQSKPETAPTPPAKTEEDPFAVAGKNFAEPPARSKAAKPSVQVADTEFLPPIVANNSDSSSAPINKPASEAPATSAKITEEEIARILGAPPLEEVKPVETPAPKPADIPTSKPVEVPATKPAESLAPPPVETQIAKPAETAVPTQPAMEPAPTRIQKEDLSVPSIEDEQHLEKMRKIRERFGMKGLKGFCPVTLHDERDLVDAKPEFSATHRSQKFHFASAEAREKFEADPVKYAPAAYGADVVALGRDRDVVEGTLDFAAWYKGRLYLFGSQENYDVFIENPAKFATLSGIE